MGRNGEDGSRRRLRECQGKDVRKEEGRERKRREERSG